MASDYSPKEETPNLGSEKFRGTPDMLGLEVNEKGWQKSTRYRRSGVLSLLVGSCLILLWIFRGNPFGTSSKSDWTRSTHSEPSIQLLKNQASSPVPSATGVLECFQVYQPLPTHEAVDEATTRDAPITPTSFEVTLMEHDFAFSYGVPFIGNYIPPKSHFNRVTMNFTVTSKGRQFDRLALMFFGDTEVWRTSTAEPTTNGIRWTYTKDMTEFMYLWKSSQKIIFDLGNLVDDTYTGIWHTMLTATFSNSWEPSAPADLIIPISARKSSSDAASVFTLPSDNATNTVTLPRNIYRAVFSVSACGQAAEEFWWGNVLQSDVDTFLPLVGALYGYSPFREVQVLIDGELAGVDWPFPTIFTGGVVPSLWRPIVGLDAFDLREHQIDITPWLPLLCDGKEHTFEIKVIGIVDDGNGSGYLTDTVGSSWYVTGKIFIWLTSDDSHVTTGTAPIIELPNPIIRTSSIITQNSTGANETLAYTINVQRTLTISSVVDNFTSIWEQTLSVANYGLYTAFGAVQVVIQKTHGIDTYSGRIGHRKTYTYPLYANTTYLPSGAGFTLDANVTRGLNVETQDILPLSDSRLSTTQKGSAHYATDGKSSSGFGDTAQTFSWFQRKPSGQDSYYRGVEAVNGTVVKDKEVLDGEDVSQRRGRSEVMQTAVLGHVSPREAIGRGPGVARTVLVQGGGV